MSVTLRVLHVEDSERDVALLTRHLARAGYALASERVETADDMRAALKNQEWDVILCDYSMPHFNALQALEVLKETGLDIPFIIISGTVGEATAVEVMRAGANDYLMKDNLARLAPTIEREVHEAENRRARRRAEEELIETASSKAESLALLDTILSSAPIGFAFHNRELVFERINETLAAINGLPVEQHIGRTLRDLLPEMAALIEPIFRLVLETGKPVINVELSGETPSDPGQRRYWLTSFYPVQTHGGEVLGVGVLV